MSAVQDNELPKLTARFRPKAEALLLSALVQEAWNEESARVSAGVQDPALREFLTAKIEARFPASDMDVLARYGLTHESDDITVRIYHEPVGGRGGWDKRISLKATRIVRVASRSGWGTNMEISTPAPYWFEPTMGLTDNGREELPSYGSSWEQYQAETRANIAAAIPLDMVAPFNAYSEAVDAYSREYRVATDWPKRHKADHGDYPTWEAICDAFPVVGAHIRKRIAEAV